MGDEGHFVLHRFFVSFFRSGKEELRVYSYAPESCIHSPSSA